LPKLVLLLLSQLHKQVHKKKNKQHLLVLLYNKHNQGQNQWLKQLDLLNQQLNLLRMVHLLLVLEMESMLLPLLTLLLVVVPIPPMMPLLLAHLVLTI
jgi:hypothetical protein